MSLSGISNAFFARQRREMGYRPVKRCFTPSKALRPIKRTTAHFAGENPHAPLGRELLPKRLLRPATSAARRSSGP